MPVELLRPEDHPGIALAANFAARKVPWLLSIRHHWCPVCDEGHAQEYRHFAHYVCQADVICWAMAVKDLAPEFAAGVCLHEYGHVLDAARRGESDFEAERRADRAVFEQLGIEIGYVGPNGIQYVNLGDLQ